MAQSSVIIVYVLFCLLVGSCGTQRRMGFYGTSIISFLITPLLMLIVLVLTAQSQPVER